jgi:hypothetical protein
VEALTTRDVWDTATTNFNRNGSSRALLLIVTILRMEDLEVVAAQVGLGVVDPGVEEMDPAVVGQAEMGVLVTEVETVTTVMPPETVLEVTEMEEEAQTMTMMTMTTISTMTEVSSPEASEQNSTIDIISPRFYLLGGENSGDDAYGDDDPVSNFNVAQCDTYGSLWLWDLSLTCEDESSLENCECTFAEELMGAGMLSCDDVSQCPNDCAVCLTCMRILGCSTGSVPAGSTKILGVSNVAFYLIAAAIGTVAISGVAYAAYRNKPDDDSLGAHLVDGQSAVSSLDGGEPTVFLAPCSPSDDDGLYDAPPIQIEAAALAAAASQDAGDAEPSSDGDVWLVPLAAAGSDGEDEEE